MSADVADPEVQIPAAEADDSARPHHFSSASTLSTARQESLENWHRNFLKAASSSLTDLLRLDFTDRKSVV